MQQKIGAIYYWKRILEMGHKEQAEEYVKTQVTERLSNPVNGDASRWIEKEIKYYQTPNYKNTKYTNAVLNKLISLSQKNNNVTLLQNDKLLEMLYKL